MAMRYRKSINLGGGLRINVGRRGVGLSAGTRHVRYSVNTSGRRTRSVSLPGTGVSWRSTSSMGASRSRPSSATAVPASPPAFRQPGLFAPKAEKQLFRAMREAAAGAPLTTWGPAFEQVAAVPRYATAAKTLGGILQLEVAPDAALAALDEVLASGADPAGDQFLTRYCAGLAMDVGLDGVNVSFPIGRDLLSALVLELYEHRGDFEAAASAAAQLSDSPVTRLLRADLALVTGHPDRAVALTEGVTNSDDIATLALAVRGGALRKLGYETAAAEALKEALRYPSRTAGPRHRARYERAQLYLGQGQRAKARADLERILADDADYPNAAAQLADLNAGA